MFGRLAAAMVRNLFGNYRLTNLLIIYAMLLADQSRVIMILEIMVVSQVLYMAFGIIGTDYLNRTILGLAKAFYIYMPITNKGEPVPLRNTNPGGFSSLVKIVCV